jgi:hypothetical protein
MKTPAFTTTWRLTIALLLLIVLPACARARHEAVSYGRQAPLHLDANQPAPFAGWLVSDADLEWLLKAAQVAQQK